MARPNVLALTKEQSYWLTWLNNSNSWIKQKSKKIQAWIRWRILWKTGNKRMMATRGKWRDESGVHYAKRIKIGVNGKSVRSMCSSHWVLEWLRRAPADAAQTFFDPIKATSNDNDAIPMCYFSSVEERVESMCCWACKTSDNVISQKFKKLTIRAWVHCCLTNWTFKRTYITAFVLCLDFSRPNPSKNNWRGNNARHSGGGFVNLIVVYCKVIRKRKNIFRTFIVVRRCCRTTQEGGSQRSTDHRATFNATTIRSAERHLLLAAAFLFVPFRHSLPEVSAL